MFVADVYIDVDDMADISHIWSKGLQLGEEFLPEDGMLICHTFTYEFNFFYS